MTPRVAFSLLIALTAAAQAPRGTVPASRAGSDSVQNGGYYALVIGIDRYPHFHPLGTAVSDAKAIARILHNSYGFETKTLLDDEATRTNILNAVSQYRRSLRSDDNLLIYYAGHGQYDRDADKAYWLPFDAEPDSSANWIIADDITTSARVLPARHVLVISDSCFSGGITRDANIRTRPDDRGIYLQKMLASKSRTLISSGGIEPVADSGSGGHSVFAGALLASLAHTAEDAFTAEDLFHSIRQPVVGGSDQIPQYNVIRNSGHVEGDFVFTRHQPVTAGIVRDKWALVVGVSNFAQSSISSLRFAAKDAMDLGALLKDPQIGRFSPDHVFMLTNELATTANIQASLNRLCTLAGPDDQVVIFLSSHGFAREGEHSASSFVSYDTDVSTPVLLYATSLQIIDFYETLRKRLQARRVLVVFDGLSPGIWSPPVNLPLRDGLEIMLSCAAGQNAYDSAKLANGVFAYYFLEALRASQGMISTGDLFQAIRDKVSSDVKQEFGGLQTPVFITGGKDSDFIFGQPGESAKR